MNQIIVAERKDGTAIMRNQKELAGRVAKATFEQLLKEDITDESRKKIEALIRKLIPPQEASDDAGKDNS